MSINFAPYLPSVAYFNNVLHFKILLYFSQSKLSLYISHLVCSTVFKALCKMNGKHTTSAHDRRNLMSTLRASSSRRAKQFCSYPQ